MKKDEHRGWGLAFQCRCSGVHGDWIPFTQQHPAKAPEPLTRCDLCQVVFPGPVRYRHMTVDEWDNLLDDLYGKKR